MPRRYHLVSLSSDICEDDFESGEGASTGCGYSGEPIGQTFLTLSDMLGYLERTFGLSNKPQDYNIEDAHLTTSKTVANHCDAQNGGWFEATEAELEAWRKGRMKLYSEDYSIHFLRCV